MGSSPSSRHTWFPPHLPTVECWPWPPQRSSRGAMPLSMPRSDGSSHNGWPRSATRSGWRHDNRASPRRGFSPSARSSPARFPRSCPFRPMSSACSRRTARTGFCSSSAAGSVRATRSSNSGVENGSQTNCVLLADVFGWSGLFIEGDARFFASLEAKYKGNGAVTTLNRMVNPEKHLLDPRRRQGSDGSRDPVHRYRRQRLLGMEGDRRCPAGHRHHRVQLRPSRRPKPRPTVQRRAARAHLLVRVLVASDRGAGEGVGLHARSHRRRRRQCLLRPPGRPR